MARKSFDQSVVRIRQLDASEGQVAFAMGDEVLEQAPMGSVGVNNDSAAILARLAAETGVEYKVLEERRFVSSRVPPTARAVGVAWAVYRQIAYVDEPERAELLKKVATEPATQYIDGAWKTPPQKRWTVDAIRTHIGKKAANPAAGSTWLIDRAFKEAAPEMILSRAFQEATPEAIDVILDKPEYRRQVYEGLHRRELDATERRERQTAADPIGRQLDEQQAMLDLQRWVTVMRRHVEQLHDDILPRLGKAPVRDPMAMRHFLATALADLDNAIGPIRHFVEHGEPDIDRFLADVLRGSKHD